MKKETEEESNIRRSLYESYKLSGETLTAYSRKVGMTYWKLQYAVRKSQREEQQQQQQSEQDPTSSTTTGGTNFKELKISPLSSVISPPLLEYTATLRGGRSLKIPLQSFSLLQVRQLVELLEGI